MNILTLLKAINSEVEMALAVAGIFERAFQAKTEDEKRKIAIETDKITFKTVDRIFKPDEEIRSTKNGEIGIKLKNKIIEAVLQHNYHFFELPNPFDEGLTLEDIKARCGLAPAKETTTTLLH